MLIKFLSGTYKEVVTLRGANLSGADLHGANLHDANLHGADLHGAYLRGANLCGANLHGANLCSANLHGANLHSAYLHGAYLRGANLCGANLHGANLSGADLHDALGLAQLSIISAGTLQVYKKTRQGVITLLIPTNVERVNAYGSRKCRAASAYVLETPEHANCISRHDPDFIYAEGKTVKPASYDPDPRVECSHGIHFFITRKEAEEYQC